MTIVEAVSMPGILDALERQGVDSTRMWAGFRGGRLDEQPDMVRFMSGNPLFFANGVVGAREEPGNPARSNPMSRIIPRTMTDD